MSDLRSVPDPAETDKKSVNAPGASRAKIYERPARAGLSPMILSIAVVIVIILAILLYMVFRH